MKVFILSVLIAVVAAGGDSYNSKGSSYAPKSSYAPSKGYGGYQQEYNYAPMPYKFGYKVNDDYTYTDFSQYEEGDDKGYVSGSYSVLLPDGRTQIVTYKDDGYGYVADVKYVGEAKYPEYTSGYKGNNNYRSYDNSNSYNMKNNYGMSHETPSYSKKTYPSTPY